MRLGLGPSLSNQVFRRVGGGVPALALTRNVRVLFIGDSTTAAVGAGNGTGAKPEITGAYPSGVPYKTAARLTALGIPSHADTVVTEANNTPAAWSEYRPEVTVTGTLSTASDSPQIGGLHLSVTTTNKWKYQFAGNFDTIRFLRHRYLNATTATGSYSIDGGAATNFAANDATADQIDWVTINVAAGVHNIEFARVASVVRLPIALEAYNSATKTAIVFAAGARNWTTTDMVVATNSNSPLNAIDDMTPDVVVIDAGINDYRQSGTTIATFKANMQTLIDKAVTSGAKVILVVPNPINTYVTTTDAWSQAAVLTAYQDLIASNPTTCTLVNAPAVYFAAGLSGATNPATYTALNANGHMYDSLHPKASVYAAEADAVGDAIKTVLTAMGIIA